MLDRVVVNHDWMSLCTSTSICTFSKLYSDHCPILLEFSISVIKVVSQFRFLKAWTLHKDCSSLVEDCWKQKIWGCPLVVHGKKLQILKKEFKLWNYSCFGNISQNVHKGEVALNSIQENCTGVVGNFNKLEKDTQDNLSLDLYIEEIFWKEKTRIKWHVEGDRDTDFFHRNSKIRNAFKPISLLRNGNETMTGLEQIDLHTVDYFKNLFATNVYLMQDFSLVDSIIHCLVNAEMNTLLTLLPSLDEIKDVVFSLNNDSASGSRQFRRVFLSNLLGDY